MTMDALIEMYWEHEYAGLAADGDDPDTLHRFAASTMAQLIAAFDDCGWWNHRGRLLELTALGWDFALVLVQALDRGWLQAL